VARTDYAVNMGDFDLWPVLVRELGTNGAGLRIRGPYNLAQGEDPDYDWPLPSPNTHEATYTGIIFRRSEVALRDVQDGTTTTYLIGEKYLNPDDYRTGRDWGDNEDMYSGGNDSGRFTLRPPARDRKGTTAISIFGSAHPGGFHMAMCDGSVRVIGYHIDSDVHRRLGHRHDGSSLDGGSF
jgi:prepilin-type processing-associated H-X9-DG protein